MEDYLDIAELKSSSRIVIEEQLIAYSEWLDLNRLLVGESATDRRTHFDLVQEFAKQNDYLRRI